MKQCGYKKRMLNLNGIAKMVLQVASKENQNKGIKKTAKSENCEIHLHSFLSVKRTADNAKRRARNQT